jgi:hypothetical protein
MRVDGSKRICFFFVSKDERRWIEFVLRTPHGLLGKVEDILHVEDCFIACDRNCDIVGSVAVSARKSKFEWNIFFHAMSFLQCQRPWFPSAGLKSRTHREWRCVARNYEGMYFLRGNNRSHAMKEEKKNSKWSARFEKVKKLFCVLKCLWAGMSWSIFS